LDAANTALGGGALPAGYSISTLNDPGSKVTLNGLLVASSYQNAWVGNYTDTLRVFLLP
jgi:hypothetical protein